jgi:hypothetical protein
MTVLNTRRHCWAATASGLEGTGGALSGDQLEGMLSEEDPAVIRRWEEGHAGAVTETPS